MLAARLTGARPDVITGVGFGSFADNPDTDYQPAKHRFRFDLFVTSHPLRADAPLEDPDQSEVPAGANP